ncbi:tripartite tricarboxylate transporter substrate-binding protein [Reyranella sp.]|uniref:Bug family tripartite tricarboxylate transporter substrate binding protein n=1 Tax=Reyranella sp. TaxID=1929291 RepID=UPI0025FE1AB1|nr:tripartite tricarboxylate transporter substrate-binding protein [Reyranella sp.]
MTILRRRSVLAGAAAATFGAPAIANAQADWPKGPIKFIVPFPPGGSTDPIARIIQAKLIELNGWNVVVDNKPGGTGVVGASIAAKSPPDGNTWLIVFDSHILNSIWTPALPYKDSELMPVMQIGRSAQGIAAHPTRPYNNFAEAVKAAKAQPGKISVAVLAASQAQVLFAAMQKDNGFEVNTIPYKGGGPLFQDALAGVTDLSVSSLVNMVPHVRAGKLKLIAVTGEQRSKAMPDTPTLAEQGIKAAPSYAWWGVYAPTGTPKPIVDRMHAEITKAVRSPDVTKKFVDQFDMDIVLSSPEQFAAYQSKEQAFWSKVIKDNNLKPE